MWDFKSMWRHGSTYCLLAILCFLGVLPTALAWIHDNLPSLIPSLPQNWQTPASLFATVAGLLFKALLQDGVKAKLDKLKGWIKATLAAGRDVGGAVRRTIAISAAALAVILSAAQLATPALKTDEGLELKAYVDMAGVLTACYGHTGPDVVKGKTYTKAECEALLNDDTFQNLKTVYLCAPNLIQDRYALAGWARFNFNTGTFCSSRWNTMKTARRLIAAGQIKASCAQMDPWVYVGKRKVKRQIERRREERAMCEAG